ncbi:MAG TPA: DUF6510 family protein [Actinomycetes bacterium]
MDDRDLRLDGNAVAGMLAEALAAEPTADLANCAGCGASNQLGALLAYVHGMGAVLRCPGCESVMLRIGRGPGRLVLDLRGIRWLRVEVG